MFQAERAEPPRGGKEVQVSDPAIGLCRKIRRFAVGGIFRWYHSTRAFEILSGVRALLKFLLERRLFMSRGAQPFER